MSAQDSSGAAPTTVAAAAAKPFRVLRAKAPLNPVQLRAVNDLITRSFNHFGVESLCHIATGEHLDVIVEKGPLRRVVNDLLRYCEEQEENKLPALLNEIIKQRPFRDDVKPLIEKLVAEGALELE